MLKVYFSGTKTLQILKHQNQSERIYRVMTRFTYK